MSGIDSLKQKLHDLHKKANLTEGLKLLDSVLKPGTGKHREVAQQLSRFNDNEQQHQMGVRDDAVYIQEKNRIRNAFPEIIDNLELEHLVSDFDKKLNPPVEGASIPTKDQSERGWQSFFLPLIVGVLLGLLPSFIIPKPTGSRPDPSGTCDSLSLKKQITGLHKAIDSVNTFIKNKNDTIKLLKSRLSLHEGKTDAIITQLIQDKTSLEDDISMLNGKLQQCINEKSPKPGDNKYKLIVSNELNGEVVSKLEGIGVHIEKKKISSEDGSINYNPVDGLVAMKIKDLLAPYYPNINIAMRPMHIQPKGSIIFRNP